MSYGVKYTCAFDPVAIAGSTGYTLKLLLKGYGGASTDVTGSTIPVLMDWQTDDPKAPIKGSSLSINLINENNSLPLSTFFAVDDDEWQVQFFYGADLIWIGFLVQDDCSETLVDFTHEINLSANDKLGLLKNVDLNKSIISYDVIVNTSGTFSTTAPNTLVVPSGFAGSVLNGDVILVETLIFTLRLTVIDNSGGTTLIVAETVPTIAPSTANLVLERPTQFPDLITIAQLFRYCLAATNLTIDTNIWGSLIEISQNTASSFIDQTLLNSQTFLQDGSGFNSYKDCYTVLEETLAAFKMTLFQSKGVWNIIRWDELRYFSNAITGYVYDSDFTLITTITHEGTFVAGPTRPVYAETGLTHKIFRPFSFVKETFNYKPPAQLLRNFDLQTVGNLIRTYTTGSGLNTLTFNEYVYPWWYQDIFLAGSPNPTEYYIRVTLDFFQNEVDRYLVCANANGSGINTTWLDSYKIEATKGDSINLSMQMRTSNNFAANARIVVAIMLDNGVTRQYLTSTGWVGSENIIREDFPGIPTNQWNSFQTDVAKYTLPNDGLLYIILLPERDTSDNICTDEYWIKDIRLDYEYFINDSTKIIGQYHQNYQGGNIKLNEDTEIFLDDSPRNSIAGTLFLPTINNLVHDRAQQWELSYLPGSQNLGSLVTFEQLFWRRIPRSILEGSMRGLFNSLGQHISMLSVVKYDTFNDLNLIFGKLQIDFKNGRFTGTLWEMWADGESDGDLINNYVFNYIYQLK